MTTSERSGDFERKMHKGDWKCADCGKDIKELPFESDPNRLNQLRCRDCYRPKRRFNR